MTPAPQPTRSIRDTRLADARLEAILAAIPAGDGLPERFAGDEWEAILARARGHGVLNIVLDWLEARFDASDRPPIGDAFARAATLNRLRRTHLDFALEQAAAALNDAGIRACALKGPVLAERYYPNPRSRVSCDLDLLVAPDDLDRAFAALEGAGYAAATSVPTAYFRRHHHHVHAQHPSGVTIELHFRAHSDFTSLEAPRLLERSRPYRLRNGSLVSVLEPEDEFLYLAVHAAAHTFAQLLWLYDLRLFVDKRQDLRWDVVAARARGEGLAGALAYACERARRFGAQIPPPAAIGLPWSGRLRLASRVADGASGRPIASPVAVGGRVASVALMCDSWRAAAAYLGRRRFRLAIWAHRDARSDEPGLVGGA